NAGGLSPAVTRTVSIDTVPPRFTGLQAAGGSTTLAVAFSKPLVCASVAPAAFSVNSGSAPQGAGPVPEGAPQGAGSIRGGRSLGVAAVSCDGVTATAVHLTLANPPRGGDQVALSVAASTGGPADQAGNNIGDPRMVSATATNVGPSASVTGGIPDGALTSNAQPVVQGSAADSDGNVTSVEASVDGSPFTGAGVSCQGCG